MGQQFTITLPDEIAEHLREQVASGEYASVDEAIEAALTFAIEVDEAEATIPDEEVEAWLREEGAARLDRHDRDPSAALGSAEFNALLEERIAARSAGGR